MVKGNTELDMRGHCSAGQKVGICEENLTIKVIISSGLSVSFLLISWFWTCFEMHAFFYSMLEKVNAQLQTWITQFQEHFLLLYNNMKLPSLPLIFNIE